MAQHKDLTEADLHEPKGVSTAAVGFVYVATGAGTGTWKKVGITELNTTGIPGLLQYVDGMNHPNINSSKTAYTVMARPGSLTKIYVVVDATVTTDVTLSFLKNGGASLGATTIPAGTAAGAIFSITLSSPVAVIAGDFITANSNGTGSVVCTASISFLFNF